jgi:hypothetical protein
MLKWFGNLSFEFIFKNLICRKNIFILLQIMIMKCPFRKVWYTSVNPVHNAPRRSPPPGPSPNHDSPKPLTQKKRTQISSPTHPPSKSQKYLPHRRWQLLRGNERKSKSKK